MQHLAARLSNPAIWLLLVFALTRAITPAGFMPAAAGQGGPFALCPGDLRSAQLLALFAATESHHYHHHHHADHPADHQHSFADLGCEFSVPGVDGALPGATLIVTSDPLPAAVATTWYRLRLTPLAHRQPPSRAPPALFYAG